MPYEVREVGVHRVVVLDGEVDLSRSPQARKTILGCLQGNHDVLVDLSLVSYIDSSGVACLVEGFQAAKKSGLQFALVGVSDPAMAVLKLARLDQIFEIYPSVEAGVSGRGRD